MNTPKIILGTFQNNNYNELRAVVDTAMMNDCFGFDTAPSYGTEQSLGFAIAECAAKYHLKRDNIYISNKVDAWQMIEGKGEIKPYIVSALKKMGLEYFDMIWIHWPIEEWLLPTWTALSTMQTEGIIKEIGICNVRERHLVKMKVHGILPKNIQIERHPMRICRNEISYCKENGIKVFDYSPMCRMHPKLKGSTLLKAIAEKHHKNIGQVILRWHIDTGTVPIFMSKKNSRVKLNLDIFDFRLSANEIAEIESLDENYKIFLESWGCPGF